MSWHLTMSYAQLKLQSKDMGIKLPWRAVLPIKSSFPLFNRGWRQVSASWYSAITIERESHKKCLQSSENCTIFSNISTVKNHFHSFIILKMHIKIFLSVLSSIALVQAQVAAPAPAPSTLTTTQSGVLPIAPTPFPGLETIEGAITYDGPIVEGFTGMPACALSSPILWLQLTTAY